jgi:hypothetical protein
MRSPSSATWWRSVIGLPSRVPAMRDEHRRAVAASTASGAMVES